MSQSVDDCVFCRILADTLPSSMIYRDELCCAFMDIQPVNPGHLLVVPLTHFSSLETLSPEIGSHLFAVAQRLAAALYCAEMGAEAALRCQGVNLFLADGSVAGQDVFHVHLHVIPRFQGDGFGLRFGPAYSKRPTRIELDQVAQGIRGCLRDGTE